MANIKWFNAVFSGLSIVLFLLLPARIIAQKYTGTDYTAYIGKYSKMAVREMKLYHIPASITLAQALIESGCGKSKLETNNHFGIKCQKDWSGDTYYYDDDAKNECFRKYNNANESYRDHSLFLSTRSRYAALFQLSPTDYKGWAAGLKAAGYATNPDYPNMLIRVIEANSLFLLDDSLGTAPSVPDPSAPLVKESPAPEVVTADAEGIRTKSGMLLFRKGYSAPDPRTFEYQYTSELGRKVYANNGVPFIFALSTDTWEGIAKEFDLYTFQVYKQNDLQAEDNPVAGQMLYLEPKKRSNPEKSVEVKPQDCLYAIAQEKGIKLNRLLRINRLSAGTEPVPGTAIKLK
jgi:hypothetical protein